MCASPSAPPPSSATPIFGRAFSAVAEFAAKACCACAKVELATTRIKLTVGNRNLLMDSLPKIQARAAAIWAHKNSTVLVGGANCLNVEVCWAGEWLWASLDLCKDEQCRPFSAYR